MKSRKPTQCNIWSNNRSLNATTTSILNWKRDNFLNKFKRISFRIKGNYQFNKLYGVVYQHISNDNKEDVNHKLFLNVSAWMTLFDGRWEFGIWIGNLDTFVFRYKIRRINMNRACEFIEKQIAKILRRYYKKWCKIEKATDIQCRNLSISFDLFSDIVD